MKLNSQRLYLENKIFARAAQLGVVVHARQGQLLADRQDALLRQLITVYNAFFYEDNRRIFCAQENGLEKWFCFAKRPSRSVLFAPNEYKFELMMEGKYVRES